MTDKKKFAISIYSPLGGQGSSLLACQLVHHLAKFGSSCLVDLNLDFSTALQYLNVEPTKAFRESAMSSGESVLLSSFAVKVEDNYYAVATPLIGYGQFAEETKEATKELFDQCRAEFDYTVMDLPHPLHVELTKNALQLSDLIVVVGENTNHSAQACAKLKQIFADARFGIDANKVVFIFNRASVRSTRGLMLRVLQGSAFIAVFELLRLYAPNFTKVSDSGFLSLCAVIVVWIFLSLRVRDHSASSLAILAKNQVSIFHQIPEDSKACRKAINSGKFLDEKTRLGPALSELAIKLKALLNK